MRQLPHLFILAACLALAAAGAARAETVEVTQLGSHEGAICVPDRALVFEDPNGTRILYDPGRPVRGSEDPRLGVIDAVLLSHVHGDHLGDAIQPEANASTCTSPRFSVKVTPVSNTVNITVAKAAELVVGAEMASFFAKKVAETGGGAEQVQLVRYGASTSVGGVEMTTVPAVHSNGLNPAFLEGDLSLRN